MPKILRLDTFASGHAVLTCSVGYCDDSKKVDQFKPKYKKMKNPMKLIALAALLAAQCGIANAGNTGVEFANGVNAGNINISTLREMSGGAPSPVNDGVFWKHNDGCSAAQVTTSATHAKFCTIANE
jgi:hypothetical protein